MTETHTDKRDPSADGNATSPGTPDRGGTGSTDPASSSDRLTEAKRRLSGFDQPDRTDEPSGSRASRSGRSMSSKHDDDDDKAFGWKLYDTVTDHLQENYRSYLIGLGTGATLLALKSSRVRKGLFGMGLQYGAAKVTSWFEGADDDDEPDPPKRSSPKKKKPSPNKKTGRSKSSTGSAKAKDSKGPAAQKASSRSKPKSGAKPGDSSGQTSIEKAGLSGKTSLIDTASLRDQSGSAGNSSKAGEEQKAESKK